MTDLTRRTLRERLAAVQGTLPPGVRLVAVTKTVSAEIAGLLPELGVLDLAENRPQELWRKAALLPHTVRWHQIGHLQRNKLAQTLPLCQLIHSVDSERLLLAIDTAGQKLTLTPQVLLQVNISREEAKSGFAPEAILALVPVVRQLHSVRVCGLMGMAAYADDAELARPAFAELRRGISP